MKHGQKHRLLSRQIKKSGLDEDTIEKILPLLNQINSAYNDFDSDIYKLEHVLELSNQELFKANKKLKSNILSKSEEIEKVHKQLDFVFNHVEAVIFQFDKNGKMVFLNQQWENLTGYTVESSLQKHYRNFLSLICPNSFNSIKDYIKNPVQTPNDSFQLIPLQDQKSKWVKMALNYIYDQNGSNSGAIGIIMDITQLKVIELKLRKSEVKERLANNAKNDFLSTMSHEIRTPLNGVIGISHILLMNEYLPEQTEQLNALKITSEHLLNLINNILDFSKIESKSITINKSDFDLDEMLEGLKINYSNIAKESKNTFSINKDSIIPKIIRGDLTRLHQILHNLLGNAFKFTQNGDVKLDIKGHRLSPNRINITFSITDTGKGIQPNKLDHIFDKFTQENTNISQKYGGTGLGLAICKQLLLMMESELFVESEVDRGSKFWFTIPFSTLKDETVNIKPVLINNTWINEIKGSNILVVDDNEVNNLVLRKILQNWGANCHFALNGIEALKLIDKENFNLILMDLQMPILNGYETCSAIRSGKSVNRNTPIIAISASSEVDSKLQAQKVGMDNYISKPFKPVELYRIIENLINKTE